MAGKRHHLAIHEHDGGGYRVEHHMIHGGGDIPTHIRHVPPKGSEAGLNHDELFEHLAGALEPYGDEEEVSEVEAKPEAPKEKIDKGPEHSDTSGYPVGKAGKVRSR